MESVDYSESEFRYELEGRNSGYGDEAFGAHGYQTQEIDENNGEFVSTEEAEDSYEDDAFADMDFEDSFDE